MRCVVGENRYAPAPGRHGVLTLQGGRAYRSGNCIDFGGDEDMKKGTRRSAPPAELPPQPPCMHEALAARAAEQPDEVLAVFDERSLTYAQVLEESRRVAGSLRERGLRKGDPVLLVLGNRAELLVLLFALAELGALAVPVNHGLKGDSLRHVFDVTRAGVAVVEEAYLPRVAEASGGLGRFSQIFLAGDPGSGASGTTPYGELLSAPAAAVAGDTERSDPWAIMFTSGTTGASKGVLMPHQQVMSSAWDVFASMRVGRHSVFYTFNPLFHLNAIVYGPLAAMLGGGRSVIRSRFPREDVLADLRAAGATHWTAPPFVMRGLLAQPPTPTDRATGLRIVTTIGITEDEARAFESRFGCQVYSGYGTTEIGMVCLPQPYRRGGAGVINPRCEVRIVDESGNELPRGSIGELWARPRRAHDRMICYYRMPEETAAAFCDGWYKSGDLGWLDEEGHFCFHDRAKDAIKRRGENISAQEVEQILVRYPGISAACVVAHRPARAAEDEVRAFLVLEPACAGAIDYPAVIAHCARHLAHFMVPRFLEVVESLPTNALGKVEKGSLRSLGLTAGTFDVKRSGIAIER